ncbi:MAG: flippase, partial [Candidatus Pacearchaeota archaeon]
MNTATRVFKNSLYLFLGYFIGGAILFILNTTIARYLGASLYGDYSFIFAFISFFTIIANFGIDVIVVKELVAKKIDAKKMLSTSLILRTILSIVAIILSIIIILVLPTGEIVRRGVILISLSLLFSSLTLSCISFFQARLEMIFFFLIETISKILYAGIIFVVFWQKLGYLALIVCYVLMTFLQFLLSYLFVKRKINIKWKLDKETAKYIIKESWPLAIMLLLASIYYRIDTIMLSFMKTSREVGYYAAAYNFAGVFTIIATAIGESLFPLLSETWKKAKKRFSQTASFGVKYLTIIALPIATSLTLLGKESINFLYGEAYLPSVTAFQILLWGTFLIFITAIFESIVIATGKQKFTTLVAIV